MGKDIGREYRVNTISISWGINVTNMQDAAEHEALWDATLIRSL
jgi:hypothetical protein